MLLFEAQVSRVDGRRDWARVPALMLLAAAAFHVIATLASGSRRLVGLVLLAVGVVHVVSSGCSGPTRPTTLLILLLVFVTL
jgi:hypothetical protein